MYGIFTYIYPINDPNVGKYSTIHGSSGIIIPNRWKNKKCFKQPTRLMYLVPSVVPLDFNPSGKASAFFAASAQLWDGPSETLHGPGGFKMF